MAKARKQPEEVVVRYDLHGLPTAQHKAGLAGLLLQIESMNERRERGADLPRPPTVIGQGRDFAEVRFTSSTTRALFDDLYDADVEEQLRRKKGRSGFRREIHVPARGAPAGPRGQKLEKRYIHEAVVPRGNFLLAYTDGGKEAWQKLWRDMLLAVPRNQDATLGPLRDMAKLRLSRMDASHWVRMDVTQRKNDKRSYLYCRDGITAWDGLVGYHWARAGGRPSATSVSGATRLGAQEKSSELVKIEEPTQLAVLLHFWPLAMRVFVPERLDADGEPQFLGYVLAVPEVSDLLGFIEAYKKGLSELGARRHRFRPAEAVISLAAEGPLAFMRHLDRLATSRALGRRPPAYLAGVEFFHMVKVGNNTKTVTHGRVPAWDGLLTRYDALMSHGGPQNSLMRAGRLQALLEGQPWFSMLTGDLMRREWSWFVHSNQEPHRTPSAMIDFASDARKQFQRLWEKEDDVQHPQDPEAVDRIVYGLVGRYVAEKAAARLGVGASDRGARRVVTHPGGRESVAYQEERRRIAQKLFLALRSRRDDDFVEHFTATLGSVAQRLPEKKYVALTTALMRTFTVQDGEDRPRTRDDVKTLALLALSAHSRSLSSRRDEHVDEAPAEAGEE